MERFVPSVRRRNSGCEEENDCRTVAIQRAQGKDTLPGNSLPPIGMESSQMLLSPLLIEKTFSMGTLSRL